MEQLFIDPPKEELRYGAINHRWHYPQFTVARKTCVYSELVERDIVEL